MILAGKTIKRHASSFRIISFGFVVVILIGCFLLMLPISSVGEGGTSFLDALFTATSAVCVTGLIVHDTATYWSTFGQTVIMLLIQIGGMGVVTVAISIAMVSGRKIGLVQRSTMQEAISAPHVGGIVRLTGFILKTAMLIEAIGVVVMAPVFCRDYGLFKGIWYALFHSVSAFCNAGFDLMGINQKFSSLTAYVGHPVVNGMIMFLIVSGGIGFLTWDDIRSHTWHLKKYRMQSKVILSVTATLLLVPAVFFYFHEFTTGRWGELSQSERILASIFQSVTPRTAGFNTVDLTRFTEPGLAIIIVLMLIGGSPGSTAGGMKTTTVAVMISSAISVFRRRESAQLFGRRVPPEAVRNGATILMMYFGLFFTGGFIISCVEGLPMLTCLFETASAIGTVGLTLGITPALGVLSRCILIMLMFFGRVGGLTLVFAAVSITHKNVSKLPQEKITVG